MNTNTMITNDNDIYVYFELIRQLHPSSILDIGMFLQRIGAVCRQAMSCEIPDSTCLEGIALMGQPSLPIYRKIYDKISPLSDFDHTSDNLYDMAIFMHVNEWLGAKERLLFWQYITTHASVILADTTDTNFVNYVIENCRAEAINIEHQQYALIYGNLH